MATRFYFSNAATDAASNPAWSTTWASTTGATQGLSLLPGKSSVSAATIGPTINNISSGQASAVAQFLSPVVRQSSPITIASTTFTGYAMEYSSASGMAGYVIARRARPSAGGSGWAMTDLVAMTGGNITAGTTLKTVVINTGGPVTAATTTFEPGDRLVVEVGVTRPASGSSTPQVAVGVGDTAANDASAAGQTGVNPWIEINDDMCFLGMTIF